MMRFFSRHHFDGLRIDLVEINGMWWGWKSGTFSMAFNLRQAWNPGRKASNEHPS